MNSSQSLKFLLISPPAILLFLAISSCAATKKGVLSPTDNGEIAVCIPSHLRPLVWKWRYSDGKMEWPIPAIQLGVSQGKGGWVVGSSTNENAILGRFLVHQSAFKELTDELNDRPPGKEATEKNVQKELEKIAASLDKNKDFFVCSDDRPPKEVLKQW